ncbi:MAG: acylneuraminate cytidylyltransferase family protein [Candidatus Scalindua sp.]|jgi:CMP-N,N'-diacetyllegionaminic acid synthase|nr:acylneuraminate cytidylyltransferase family protein [Candidatus Scalindua sp.]MBT6231533.1 acylneuraminate cytidylyltransferase family protein [Candidatus Scalindua sp.]
MYKGKRIIGMIPARGGSKGLQGKNIKPFLGKPLIAWTIEQAENSKYIDTLIVNTDDDDIAQIARQYGAEIPFLRPEELAEDSSAIFEAILHMQEYYESQKSPYDLLVMMECTSPIRYTEDIDNVIEKLVNNEDADSVVGVVELTNEHPSWTFQLAGNYLASFIPESSTIENYNRQLLKRAFLPYSIYATWWKNFKKYKKFYQSNTMPYIMKREQKVEIDDEVDFYLAECIFMKYLQGHES